MSQDALIEFALKSIQGLGVKSRQVDQLLWLKVQYARTLGATWSQIGGELGISKQGAQQRYGRSPGRSTEPVK